MESTGMNTTSTHIYNITIFGVYISQTDSLSCDQLQVKDML